MRIAHISDWHAKEEAYDLLETNIAVLEHEHAARPFDLIAFSGDWWHGAPMATARARYADFLSLMRRLADMAPVVMVSGTPTHDVEGSLEVFEQLKARYPIRILRPGLPYYLSMATGRIYDNPLGEEGNRDAGQLLIFGLPEPSKKWLFAGQEAAGKDDSDAAVRDRLRAILLGYGAIRREHADLPCLLVYHGDIYGATTAVGHSTEIGTGIAVSRDDLAAVGADYYACGHVHEPQEIPGLPGGYAGSGYPKDFGETHKAGANIAEIGTEGEPGHENHFTDVSRLHFPHARRVHIVAKPDDMYHREDVAGRIAWVEIVCTREESANFDPEEGLRRLVSEDGALTGSRFSLTPLPVETVRASEIVDKKTLREKVIVQSEAGGQTAPEGALKKADEIEREAAAVGTATGAHLRIDRLRLRGAKGIWKKGRKDEIDIDLEAMGEGVLGLVGPNGYGKSTILENLHAWPMLLTRDGTLKDHFRLRDSARELWFTDLRTGWKYRALINIRADIASGAAEYYLFCDKGAGEEPLPGVDGRLKPYEDAIGALWGSLEMYLQTAFQAQKATKYAPDLGQATQGQRKALFAELAGIDYLERYRETCKSKADVIDARLRELGAAIAVAAGVDEEIERLEKEKGEAEAKEIGAQKAAAAITEAGKKLAAERETLAAAAAEIDRKAERGRQVEREISDLIKAGEAIDTEIAGYQAAAKGREAAEAELERIRGLEAKKLELEAAKAKVAEREQKDCEAFRNQQEEIRAHSQTTLQPALERARKAQAEAEKALAVAKARQTAPVAEACPTCGQALPADRLEALRHAREEAEQEVAKLEAAEKDAAGALRAAKDAYEASATEFSALKPPEPRPFERQVELAEVLAELDFSDKAAAEATLRQAGEAAVRIEAAQTRRQEADGRKQSLAKEAADIARFISEAEAPARQELAAKDEALARARDQLTEARSAQAAAKATAEAAARGLESAQKRRAARDAAQTEKGAAEAELTDWRFLERAVGRDGIQALELDALAPSIAEVANKLLGEAYGSRYKIEFRTQREAGKGKSAKMVEDFEIYILDTESGDEQTIDSLSGGESVWIKRSLYSAFGIIRARNTGVQFATVIQDEADGALDPEARMMYLRMIEAERRERGGYQTILVTHDKAIQAMVERTIDVTSLGPRGVASEKKVAA
jgi:exonuclease SbcC